MRIRNGAVPRTPASIWNIDRDGTSFPVVVRGVRVVIRPDGAAIANVAGAVPREPFAEGGQARGGISKSKRGYLDRSTPASDLSKGEAAVQVVTLAIVVHRIDCGADQRGDLLAQLGLLLGTLLGLAFIGSLVHVAHGLAAVTLRRPQPPPQFHDRLIDFRLIGGYFLEHPVLGGLHDLKMAIE